MLAKRWLHQRPQSIVFGAIDNQNAPPEDLGDSIRFSAPGELMAFGDVKIADRRPGLSVPPY